MCVEGGQGGVWGLPQHSLWPSGPRVSLYTPPPPLPREAASHSPEPRAMRMSQSSFLERTQGSCFSDPGALACGPCSCLCPGGKGGQGPGRRLNRPSHFRSVLILCRIQQTPRPFRGRADPAFKDSPAIRQMDKCTEGVTGPCR